MGMQWGWLFALPCLSPHRSSVLSCQSPTGEWWKETSLLLPSGNLGSTPTSSSKSLFLCTPHLGLSFYTCHSRELSFEGCRRPQMWQHLRGTAGGATGPPLWPGTPRRPLRLAMAPATSSLTLHTAQLWAQSISWAMISLDTLSSTPFIAFTTSVITVLYLLHMFLSNHLLFDLDLFYKAILVLYHKWGG